ncbi:hypothetical protein [Paenibacillus silvisoli]|uniref:hypothetical protein n=1 Tax=Paenibacillus silvisoli TaxID=3110539 RepID=UPI0028048D3C|nr:hypothetical protein [Paenibacillus silvisoli]
MAAYLIEEIGHHISFHPQGRGSTKGEFNILTPIGDIFTELKSPIRKPPHKAWAGNDSKSIRKIIKDAAHMQFDTKMMNQYLLNPLYFLSLGTPLDVDVHADK